MQRVASNPFLSAGGGGPPLQSLPRSNSAPMLPGAMPPPMMPPGPETMGMPGGPPSFPPSFPSQAYGPGGFAQMMGPPPAGVLGTPPGSPRMPPGSPRMQPGSMPGGPPMDGMPGGPPMGSMPGGPPMGSMPGGPPMGSMPGGPPMGSVPGGPPMGSMPGGPPMGSMPGGPPMGNMPGGPPMSGTFFEPPSAGSFPPTAMLPQGPGIVTVEVTRLMDMPMQEKMLSGDLKQYRVRAYDDQNKEIACTKELAGIREKYAVQNNTDTETIRLGPEGTLTMNTNSPLIYLQVDYAGGFLGNMRIGRCRIHRSDPRSQQVWPYALSDRNGEQVGCGIELKVTEGPPMPNEFQSFPDMPQGPSMPSPLTMPPQTMEPSFNTMPPQSMPPQTMGPSFNTMPPQSMPPQTMGPSFNTMPPQSMMPQTMGPSFNTMPPEGMLPQSMGPSLPGTPPLSPRAEPSFNTMPPWAMDGYAKGSPFMDKGMDKGKGKGKDMFFFNSMEKGKGKGTPPGTPKGKGKGWQTMPPGSLGMPPPQVDRALMSGQDVTAVFNQLIAANGYKDPTGGARVQHIFENIYRSTMAEGGADGVLSVMKGNLAALDFADAYNPPYDLSPLFEQAKPSFHTMPPMGSGPLPPTSGSLGVPQQGEGNVAAVVEIEKITDLPEPRDRSEGEVVLTLLDAQGNTEVAKSRPLKAKQKGSLREIVYPDLKLQMNCSMQHLAQNGAKVILVASYQKSGFMSSITGDTVEKIGQTEPFVVNWTPNPAKYFALMGEKGDVGGITLAHRFARASDMRSMVGRKGDNESQVVGTIPHSGVTQTFKKNSVEGKAELAALALEAQNRAFLQRIKMADPNGHDTSGLMWTNDKGYRQWNDLDSLFVTMGPNYVAQSNEVGPNICQVYEDDTSVWQELMQKYGKEALHPVTEEGVRKDFDKATKLRLIKTMYPGDPEKVQSTLRPMICRSREDIKRDEERIRRGAFKPPEEFPVKVTIKRAHKLMTSEGLRLSPQDPYVEVQVAGKPNTKWSTPAVPASPNPEWNRIGEISGIQQGEALQFTVKSKGLAGFDGHLGEYKMDWAQFYPESFNLAQIPLFKQGKSGNQAQSGPQQAQLVVEVRVLGMFHGEKDWPPETPIYAPLQNLNDADQETQRLANWSKEQCAKLPFADVNPNYQINEDIWGAMADTKASNSRLMSRPKGWKPNRVKDSCMMA